MDDIFPFIPGFRKKVFQSSVDYKQFKLNPEETLSDYTRFYLNKFSEILDWYYPYKQDNIILYAGRQLNDYRSLSSKLDSSGEYYFSVSVFFINLIPKVLDKMSGKSSMDLFYKASGWPKMSAGLAGFVNPLMWLEESDLAPAEGELLYYSSLMEIVLPYHSQELRTFLEGNQPNLNQWAYETLCANVSHKVESIITELEAEVKDYWKL